MATPEGMCEPWITADDVCTSDEELERAQQAADEAMAWLFRATCAQFTGLCTSLIRPDVRGGKSCRPSTSALDPQPRWHRVDLTTMVPGAIRSIIEVQVEGVVIDSDDYRLVRGKYLVPHTGGGLDPWPFQDLNRPDGDIDTWSALVEHGNPAPADLVEAARQLATQLLNKACGRECDLPDNATSISRDGMSIELRIPERGETGLPLVDSIVALYPCASRRRILDPAEPFGDVVRLPGGS